MTEEISPTSPELLAERALLGALLLNAPAVEEVGAWLHPGHFYRLLHRELYGLLLARQRAGHPASAAGATEADRTDWARGTIDQARSLRGFTPDYAHMLIASSPHPAHARAYATLVLEAAVRREVTEHATRLSNSAAAGHHADVVVLVPALDRTLGRCSVVWSSATAEVQGPAYAESWTAPLPRPTTATEEALADEATLINVLMAQPRALPSLAGHLLPGDFADPLHRLVYEAMVDLSERAQPVDALTVLWQARAGASTPAVDLVRVQSLIRHDLPGDPDYWAERLITASVLRTTHTCANQLRDLAADPRRPVAALLGDAEQLVGQLRTATGRIQLDHPAPTGPAATAVPHGQAPVPSGQRQRASTAATAPVPDGRRAPPHGAKEDTYSPPSSHPRSAELPAAGRRRR
ncbi:DnaB-like helicase N-terminal domain-containing protein [Streptacidiphilus sp. MAP5-52]|uniref:DnaB-like helicase N-terminal domain-containing protein n=1 Tax=Streptacidiphilus sp. MAP5-52 TaxID=3156267 RepID=UPI0035151881